jgi:RHS repeat-associated protein
VNVTSLGYDLDGNISSYGSQTYTYDARGQLASTSGGTASFSYDGLGRRVSKTVSGTTTSYLYDGGNIVQDTTGATVGNEMEGPGVDQTWYRAETTGRTTTPRSYLADALGSTLALADPAATPVVKASYTYDPYGNATVTGSAPTNPFTFTGREQDGATGLQYNRARYYCPTFGRFVSEDPLGFHGSGTNVYGYAAQSPINLSDALGLTKSCGGFFGSFSCINAEPSSRISNSSDGTTGISPIPLPREQSLGWVLVILLGLFSLGEGIHTFVRADKLRARPDLRNNPSMLSFIGVMLLFGGVVGVVLGTFGFIHSR